MESELETFDVQFRSISLTSSYITSVSLVFEVILHPSSPGQLATLTNFDTYFNSRNFTFGGFEVREDYRGSRGITSASNVVLPFLS